MMHVHLAEVDEAAAVAPFAASIAALPALESLNVSGAVRTCMLQLFLPLS